LGRFICDSFLVGNNWVSFLDVTLGIFFNKIFKADLDMELTTTGNDVFA